MENLESVDVKTLVTDDQNNKGSVSCLFCNSLILNPGMGKYQNQEYSLPHMWRRKADAGNQIESESLSDYWFVSNIFIFENVGLSKVVQGKKYLACADCETGPIGYVTDTDTCFVAIKRVKHKDVS